MKALGRVAAIASLAAVIAGAQPAQAAEYTIAVTSWAGTSALRQVFVARDCSAEVVNSQLNGIEARIVDVRAFAGKHINLNWRATNAGGSISTTMFGPKCELKMVDNGFSTTPGIFKQFVPAGTAWMLVEGTRVFDVRFTVALA